MMALSRFSCSTRAAVTEAMATNTVCARILSAAHRNKKQCRETGCDVLSAAAEFARAREASRQWSVLLNILEARAHSGFYRVLLKL